MDSLYLTPLFDMFRRGEVAHDIRMLAAQGVLAPRAHEQLALLALLAVDSDAGVRAEAQRTLDRIPPAALRAFLARSDVSPDLRDFFAVRGITPAEMPAPSGHDPLVETEVGAVADAGPPAGDDAHSGDDGDAEGEQRRMATVQRLSLMTVTERVKAAMRGTREERAILIRDPNKLVAIAVLSSPKLSEQEVEGISRMASVSEDVLRVIGTTRAWVKNYAIIHGLCRNPKTPVALSLNFVKHLLERDVRGLTTDRNIPEPLKIAARKIFQAGQSRRN